MNMSMSVHASAVAALAVCAVGAAAQAQTYGNTTPFEDVSNHSPNYVLGVQVTLTDEVALQSFGMIYGSPTGSVTTSHAMFALYAADGQGGIPMTLVAATGDVLLDSPGTYTTPFTSNPTVGPGTYWMMAMYESPASPRMGLLDAGITVAYQSRSYGDGMPASMSGVNLYNGQNFNYWVNGTVTPAPGAAAALALAALAAGRRRR
jgi:MYXO-CTERM domain-containing protein